MRNGGSCKPMVARIKREGEKEAPCACGGIASSCRFTNQLNQLIYIISLFSSCHDACLKSQHGYRLHRRRSAPFLFSASRFSRFALPAFRHVLTHTRTHARTHRLAMMAAFYHFKHTRGDAESVLYINHDARRARCMAQ